MPQLPPVTDADWEARRRANEAPQGDAYEDPPARTPIDVAAEKARLYGELRRMRDAVVSPEDRTALPGDAPAPPPVESAPAPPAPPEPALEQHVTVDGRSRLDQILGIRPYTAQERAELAGGTLVLAYPIRPFALARYPLGRTGPT